MFLVKRVSAAHLLGWGSAAHMELKRIAFSARTLVVELKVT